MQVYEILIIAVVLVVALHETMYSSKYSQDEVVLPLFMATPQVVAPSNAELTSTGANRVSRATKESMRVDLFGRGDNDGEPKFSYFPIGARGELCRLIALVGGLSINEVAPITGEDVKAYGSPSGLPVLEHGDMKMAQSIAIETYLSQIAPKYKKLNPKQRAIDTMFAAIKEDVIQGMAAIIFGDTSVAAEALPKVTEKWFSIIEGRLPEEGFILGLDIPTTADLSLLVIAKSRMPFTAAYELAGTTEDAVFAKYPKMKALVERVAAVPEVAQYLANPDASMYAGAFGY